MPSFLTKVFGRKKDDKLASSPPSHASKRHSNASLLEGKYEAVSPSVSPSAARFSEAQQPKDKDSGTANPLTITLPGWTNGQYRFRVSATSPATTGEVSEPISVGGTGSGLPFPLPPNDLSTLQDGNWNNPLIWSCGWVPTLSNLTELKHTVTVPAGFQAETKTIRYVNGAKLIYESSGKVRFSGN